MRPYLQLLQDIMQHGTVKSDRTGVGTRSIFGYQMRFDLNQGFPLVTTKRIYLKALFHELLWFIRGETNVKSLQQEGVRIWNEWANEAGELGPIYGAQWRSWGTASGQSIDQLAQVVCDIQQHPDSRRLIVSAWNVGELDDMALAPCHLLFQFYVADGKLSCQLYQRSADAFLGVPFNIASYATLTQMIAQVCGLQVGDFIWTGGDCHIYQNHFEQVKLQLSRTPHPLPQLHLNPQIQDLFDFTYADIQVENYQHDPAISAPIAV